MDIVEIYQLLKSQNYNLTTDSRKIKKGSIFLALKGQNFDGHSFINDALQNGCEYAIAEYYDGSYKDKVIIVENTLQTLQKLAHFHRTQSRFKVIGITGTNGKTTTKELVAAVLSKKYKTVKTEGNLNNHIGVPLTLLSVPENSDFAVIEMGANRPGEIQELCNIAVPDYGIVTNVGKAHLEGFGSFENIFTTKIALYSSVGKNNGVIFVNSEHKYLVDVAKNYKTFYYGKTPNNNVYICNAIANPFVEVEWKYSSLKFKLSSKLLGLYNWENIAAAISVGHFFNVPSENIISAIESYTPSNNRSQLITTTYNKIYMDAYNANPTSMMLAIENFLEIAKNENKTLILGDMLELGSHSEEEHINILLKLYNLKDIEVFLVGDIFSALNRSTNFKTFLNVNELIEFLKNNPLKNRTILVKGSNKIALNKIVEYL
ncbi:MAG: UDP-N-acetylmuramoyl-tripeptide--D-alanyl-D-alanine ligase [Bacteroidales bacterium]|nr:UDP-N-acetylmuramoyl-tripeptide--D-alanyl-D-alanine ligase [Bacteroidales bacterium]